MGVVKYLHPECDECGFVDTLLGVRFIDDELAAKTRVLEEASEKFVIQDEKCFCSRECFEKHENRGAKEQTFREWLEEIGAHDSIFNPPDFTHKKEHFLRCVSLMGEFIDYKLRGDHERS